MHQDAIFDWLFQLTDHEKTPGTGEYKTGVVQNLLKESGFWPFQPKVFHIAGTKGKGSTASYIAAMLDESGKTGLYTSPHVERLTERIRVGSREIQEEKLLELARRYETIIRKSGATFFDAMTFIACVWFMEEHCEYAVLETGLGGRLDSTNFCDPLVSVITPISFDHTHLLGETLAAIAGEKSGIIKPGRPVVVAEQKAEAMTVFAAASEEKASPIGTLSSMVTLKTGKPSLEGIRADFYFTDGTTYPGIQIAMPAPVFAANLALAILALKTVGIIVEQGRIEKAAAIRLKARMEYLGGVLYDGAHNDASLTALFQTLETMELPAKPELWIGVLEDKEIERIADVVRRYAGDFAGIHVFGFEAYRRSGAEKLHSLIRSTGAILEDRPKPDLSGRFRVVTGSFYAVRAYQLAAQEEKQ